MHPLLRCCPYFIYAQIKWPTLLETSCFFLYRYRTFDLDHAGARQALLYCNIQTGQLSFLYIFSLATILRSTIRSARQKNEGKVCSHPNKSHLLQNKKQYRNNNKKYCTANCEMHSGEFAFQIGQPSFRIKQKLDDPVCSVFFLGFSLRASITFLFSRRKVDSKQEK